MRTRILNEGTYPVLEVTLAPGEEFVSEAGAMTWMDPQVDARTSSRGGVLAGLGRSLLTKESFFQNTYSTQAESGTVAFAPGQAGDIHEMAMAGEEVFLEAGAYLGSTPDVKIESKFQGLSGLLKEGMFAIRATGSGTLFFTAYGDIVEVAVNGQYVVDNGFAVAWDATLSYELHRAKRVRSFLFGDQLLMRFSGQGRLWVQSRSPAALANFMHPFRRVKKQSG